MIHPNRTILIITARSLEAAKKNAALKAALSAELRRRWSDPIDSLEKL
jgi:hypothetical protein